MLAEGLIALLVGVIDAAYALLPTWPWTLDDVPSTGSNIIMWNQGEVATSGNSALTGPWVVLAKTNTFLPVDHVLLALQFFSLLVGAGLAFRFCRFMLGLVRGSGGS